MLFLFRYVLAAGLFSPLEGITFDDWLRLLRRELEDALALSGCPDLASIDRSLVRP